MRNDIRKNIEARMRELRKFRLHGYVCLVMTVLTCEKIYDTNVSRALTLTGNIKYARTLAISLADAAFVISALNSVRLDDARLHRFMLQAARMIAVMGLVGFLYAIAVPSDMAVTLGAEMGGCAIGLAFPVALLGWLAKSYGK